MYFKIEWMIYNVAILLDLVFFFYRIMMMMLMFGSLWVLHAKYNKLFHTEESGHLLLSTKELSWVLSLVLSFLLFFMGKEFLLKY